MVKRGRTDRDLLEDEDTCQAAFKYHKSVAWMRNTLVKPRREPPQVCVLWGRTGTGKSWRARDMADDYADDENGTVLYKMNGNKWFDGLNGQTKVLVWDEYVPEEAGVNLGFILRMLDGYPLQVEYKGGAMEFNVPYIIFTSNYNPIGWYDTANPPSRAAWARRLNTVEIVHMDEPWVETDNQN